MKRCNWSLDWFTASNLFIVPSIVTVINWGNLHSETFWHDDLNLHNWPRDEWIGRFGCLWCQLLGSAFIHHFDCFFLCFVAVMSRPFVAIVISWHFSCKQIWLEALQMVDYSRRDHHFDGFDSFTGCSSRLLFYFDCLWDCI